MSRLSAYRALFLHNAGLALLATVLVPVTRLAVQVVPFSVLRKCSLFPLLIRGHSVPGDRARRRRLTAAVRIVSAFVPGATCLTQALATQWLLSIRGELTELRVGASRGFDGSFRAHAWLEAMGEILVGDLPNLQEYRPLTAGRGKP